MLSARGILVSHESVRQWAFKFGREFANRIRRRLPQAGDKWQLDEVVRAFLDQGIHTSLGDLAPSAVHSRSRSGD